MVEDRDPPEMVRVLLESVARALHADAGRWILELVVEDGRLVKVYRHEGPVLPRDLDARFGRLG